MAGQHQPMTESRKAEIQRMLEERAKAREDKQRRIQEERARRDKEYKDQLEKATPFGGANRGSRAGLQRFD